MKSINLEVPNISPGLIEVGEHILRGYIREAFIHRVFWVTDDLCIPKIHNLVSNQRD